MTRGEQFDTIGFDADDTLWRSEDYFTVAEQVFVEAVSPYAPDGIDVLDALHATEIDNVPISGYGVKAYGLSMVQAAVTATGGRIPSSVIGELVDHAHEMLMHPVELLDGVPETLAAVGRSHRLVLITKGDLVHQLRKVRTSGLAHHFEHIRVVLEKDVATYAEMLDEWGVDATGSSWSATRSSPTCSRSSSSAARASTSRTTSRGHTSSCSTTPVASPSWPRSAN